MKKLALFLCILTMFSIVGCSNKDSSSESSNESSTESIATESNANETSSMTEYVDRFPSILKSDVTENAEGWVYYNVLMSVIEENKDKKDLAEIIEYSKVSDDVVAVTFEAYNVKTNTFAFAVRKDNSINNNYIMYVDANKNVTFSEISTALKSLTK